MLRRTAERESLMDIKCSPKVTDARRARSPLPRRFGGSFARPFRCFGGLARAPRARKTRRQEFRWRTRTRNTLTQFYNQSSERAAGGCVGARAKSIRFFAVRLSSLVCYANESHENKKPALMMSHRGRRRGANKRDKCAAHTAKRAAEYFSREREISSHRVAREQC